MLAFKHEETITIDLFTTILSLFTYSVKHIQCFLLEVNSQAYVIVNRLISLDSILLFFLLKIYCNINEYIRLVKVNKKINLYFIKIYARLFLWYHNLCSRQRGYDHVLSHTNIFGIPVWWLMKQERDKIHKELKNE